MITLDIVRSVQEAHRIASEIAASVKDEKTPPFEREVSPSHMAAGIIRILEDLLDAKFQVSTKELASENTLITVARV